MRLIYNSEDLRKKLNEIYKGKFDFSITEYVKKEKKVKFICPIHGVVENTKQKLYAGKGCPKCNRNILTNETFKEKANKVHNGKYDYSKVDLNKKNTNSKVIITCPIHGDFEQSVASHLNGQGGPKCVGKNKTVESIIQKFREVHGDEYDYSLIKEYKKNSIELPIICHKKDEFGEEHGIFYQCYTVHTKGHGCPICSNNKRLNNEIFLKKVSRIHKGKYQYPNLDIHNNRDKIKIICPIHGEFEQSVSSHLNGQGCPKCVGKNKTTEEFVEELRKIFGDKYDYSKVKYENAKKKVTIICKKHGEFTAKPNNLLFGKGCPICNESSLERKIRQILQENNIENIPQKKFEWLKLKKQQALDFYLPKYNIAIECQGVQHYEEKENFFGSKKNKEILLKRDINKSKLCEENNIKILYIFNDDADFDKIFTNEELNLYNEKNSIHIKDFLDYIKLYL